MTANPQNTVEILDSISVESFETDADRYEAKEAAKRLLARLETPFERSWALSFENPVLIAGLQLCQDLGIWSKWVTTQGNEGGVQTLDEILKMCAVPVQPNLLRKLIQPLSSYCSFLMFHSSRPFSETPCCHQRPRGDWSGCLATGSFCKSHGRRHNEYPSFCASWVSLGLDSFTSFRPWVIQILHHIL